MRQGFAIALIIGVLFALWLVNTGRANRFAAALKSGWDSTSQPAGYKAALPVAANTSSSTANPANPIASTGGGPDKQTVISGAIGSLGPVGDAINGVAKVFGIKW